MIEPWIGDCFFLCDVLNLKEHICSSVKTTVKIHAFKIRKFTYVTSSVSCMLQAVELGNPKTGYIFVQILKSGYAKRMLIDKGEHYATTWAAGPRHPLVQVTPSGNLVN